MQLYETPEAEPQWKIERILSHSGLRKDSIFEILWSSGDHTWLSYNEISNLPCLAEYLDLLGCSDISDLPRGKPIPEEISTDNPEALALASLSFRHEEIFNPTGPTTSIYDLPLTNDSSYQSPTSPTPLHSHIIPSLFLPAMAEPETVMTEPETAGTETTMTELGTASDSHDDSGLSSDFEDEHTFSWENVQFQHVFRISEEFFEYYLGDYTHQVSATEVRFYLELDYALKKPGGTAGVVPSPGYVAFACAWNAENTPFKLAYFDPDHDPRATNTPTPLLHKYSPSPPVSKFGVAKHQTVSDHILLPGYVAVEKKELDCLRKVAEQESMRLVMARERGIVKRAERKRHQNTYKSGGLGFVDPKIKASLDTARGKRRF
ncbi:hypothetical protein VKT23_008250 [Stygiomarasmius scandens]|uniref:Uncharacterized protein n=1 Tax=Marasmiellus scandens TaxID=2682957 RepID=A0ABR1JHQ2_9AGAR